MAQERKVSALYGGQSELAPEVPAEDMEGSAYRAPDVFASVGKNPAPGAARSAFSLGATLGSPGKVGKADDADLINSLMTEFRGVVTGVSDYGPIAKTAAAEAGRREVMARKEAALAAIGMTPPGSPLRDNLAYEYAVMDSLSQQGDEDLAAVSSVIGTVADRAYIESGSFLDPATFREHYGKHVTLDTVDSINSAIKYISGASDEMPVLDMDLFYEVPQLVLPFVSVMAAVNMGLISRASLPESAQSFGDWFLPGNVSEKLAEAIANASPEERDQLARTIRESIRTYSGGKVIGLPGSDLEEFGNLTELQDDLTEILEGDDSIDWTKLLNNIGGATSWLPPMAAAMQALRIVPRLLGTKATKGTLNAKAVSDMAEGQRIMLDAMIDNAEEALKMLNMTREELALASLPKPRADATKVTRTLSDVTKADIETSVTIATDAAMKPLTRADVAGALDNLTELRSEYTAVAARQVGSNVSASQSVILGVDEATETFTFRAFIGADSKSGFSELRYAEAEAARRGYKDATIYVYDKADDAYRPILPSERASPVSGEYYVVKDFQLGLNQDYFATLASQRGVAASGLGNWWTTMMHRTTGQLRELANVAIGREAATAEQFRRSLLPYENLSAKERSVVDELLVANDGKKWFSLTELMAPIEVGGKVVVLSDKQIGAYKAYQATVAGMHARINRVERARLMSDGMRWLYSADKTLNTPAKQLNAVTEAMDAFGSAQVLRIYDPLTKTVRSMSKEDVAVEYLNNAQLAQLDSPLKWGKERIDFAVVRQSDGVTFADLPMTVVKFEPGYVPRMYKAPWVVSRTVEVKRSNGQVVTETEYLGGAEDYKAAVEWAASKGGEGITVEPNPLLSGKWNVQAKRALETENAMFYQDRGSPMQSIAQAEVRESPAESINRAVHAISSRIETGRLMEKVEAQWIREFGKYLPDAARPATKQELKELLKRENVPVQVINEAVASYDWIAAMRRELTYGQASINWAISGRFATALAKGEYDSKLARALLDNKLGRSIGTSLMESPDPVQLARTSAYITQILANPIKQWIINSPQLSLFAVKSPTNAIPAMTIDATYLGVRWQAERHGIKAKNLAAEFVDEAAGSLSSADYNAMFKAFKNSGLGDVQSVAIALENTVGVLGNKAIHALGELGFASAERHNLAAAFSFAARLKAEQSNKLIANFSPRDWDAVVGEARQYALNMTRADAFNYQRGLLAAAMQYVAVRHKAFNAIRSGDQLKDNRAKAVATMAALYGTDGVGLTYTVTNFLGKLGVNWDVVAEELPMDVSGDELKMFIEGGLYDSVLNTVGDKLMDNSLGSHAEFSKAISPFADNDKIIWALANFVSSGGDVGAVVDIALGPSSSVFANAANLGSTVSKYLTTDTYDTPEDVAIATLRNVAFMFSGSSNAVRAYLGWGAGEYLDRYGSPVASATAFELVAMAAGIQPKEVREFYDMRSALGRDFSEDNLRSDIEELTRFFTSEFQLAGDWETLEQRMHFYNMVISGLSLSTENEILVQSVRSEVSRRLENATDPKNKRFYDNLLQRATAGAGPKAVDNPRELLSALRNTSYYQSNPEKLNQIIELMNGDLKDGK